MHRGATLKVGQREVRLAVAAVGGSQQREQGGVLRQGQQLPVAPGPTTRREVERKYADLGNTIDSILKVIGEDQVVDFARRFVMENGVEVFNFGKFKGRPVADVLKSEPQYYDWMMKGDFPQHTKQKLTEIYTRTMLKKG